jgi:hypothetical protein
MACPCGSNCGRSALAAGRSPPEQAGIRPRGVGMLVASTASRGSDARIAMVRCGHRLLGLTAELLKITVFMSNCPGGARGSDVTFSGQWH